MVGIEFRAILYAEAQVVVAHLDYTLKQRCAAAHIFCALAVDVCVVDKSAEHIARVNTQRQPFHRCGTQTEIHLIERAVARMGIAAVYNFVAEAVAHLRIRDKTGRSAEPLGKRHLQGYIVEAAGEVATLLAGVFRLKRLDVGTDVEKEGQRVHPRIARRIHKVYLAP